MNHSGDAAEQVVRISLEGMEFALKIAGTGAKHIAAFLIAALKSDNADGQKIKLKGKERLTNMLKSGKELKIFAIKNSELEQFSKEAKRYGVVYCALKDKKGEPDSLVDIMAKAEDASKISRIMERLQFATVDRASIESKMAEQDKKITPEEKEIDNLLNLLIDKDGNAQPPSPPAADIGSGDSPQNPTQAGTEKDHPSVSRYRTQSSSEGGTQGTKKPASVHEFLQVRTAAQRQKDKQPARVQPIARPKVQPRPIQHQQPPNHGGRKIKKSKER